MIGLVKHIVHKTLGKQHIKNWAYKINIQLCRLQNLQQIRKTIFRLTVIIIQSEESLRKRTGQNGHLFCVCAWYIPRLHWTSVFAVGHARYTVQWLPWSVGQLESLVSGVGQWQSIVQPPDPGAQVKSTRPSLLSRFPSLQCVDGRLFGSNCLACWSGLAVRCSNRCWPVLAFRTRMACVARARMTQ